MNERTIEDRLREEYFDLLPDIRRVAEQLETRVRHVLLPVSLSLDKYERILIKSRIKECESAVEALRRRQEAATFDRQGSKKYTLTDLKDLAGVRVLVFPRKRLGQVSRKLRQKFASWQADPVPGLQKRDEPLALKYFGYGTASRKVRGELQIVPMLTGLFWDVEHSAIYKLDPVLKGASKEFSVRERTQQIINAFRAFEDEFADLIQSAATGHRKKSKKWFR